MTPGKTAYLRRFYKRLDVDRYDLVLLVKESLQHEIMRLMNPSVPRMGIHEKQAIRMALEVVVQGAAWELCYEIDQVHAINRALRKFLGKLWDEPFVTEDTLKRKVKWWVEL